jgi:hypothetical protein
MGKSSKLSVEEVLANLELRAIFHREQEALHAQKVAWHQAEQALHAGELEEVLQSLEAFRAVAAAAVGLAQPLPEPADPASQADLPPPGRMMVSRLLRRVAERPGLAEPFSATAVAAEANRRFADRLSEPIQARTAADVLRRMVREGRLQIAQEGKAFHEALYVRRQPSR